MGGETVAPEKVKTAHADLIEAHTTTAAKPQKGEQMEITINRKKKGLVRVVIGIASRYSNRLSTNYDDCEENGNIRVVGFWHRHDDPNVETELTKEANLILAAYSKMWNYSGSLIEVEWKEYKS